MKTKVIFKKFPDGDVIALFPELAGDMNPFRTCLSYMAIGQHSDASVDLASLKSASFEEYKALYYELTVVIGYDLQVIKRFSNKMLQERIKQCQDCEKS